MKSILVVGSGFSGTVLARKLAEESGYKVTVVERRSHIGGNMYDFYDQNGILLHKYGPHVLVTNRWKIIKYLSQFASFYKHPVKELSFIDGKYVRLPFNFESVQQLIGEEQAETLLTLLRKEFKGRDRVPVLELVRNDVKQISDFGMLLFRKAYVTYCSKQWGVPIEELDTSILNRVPMAMNYDERYMNKDFQFLPSNGYTELFHKMLDHPNITVKTSTDALEGLKFDEHGEIFYENSRIDICVYTGAIDELFGYCYGELPYRSLRIDYEWSDRESVLPEEIISYPQAVGFTRKTEYRKLMKDSANCRGSTISIEYPTAYIRGSGLVPFYPQITEETKSLHAKYLELSKKYNNLYLCGRLAEFRYYNMDDCILNAFNVYERIITESK